MSRLREINSNEERAVVKALDESVVPATEEWAATTAPNGPKGTIVLACGPSKNILRSDMARTGASLCYSPVISGHDFNLAAFIPQYIYSSDMTVDQLADLAAYSIFSAHDLDSKMVNGCDVFIYRDSVGKFEPLKAEDIERRVVALAGRLKACFRST
jgi:hypothetical protein